jgi:hypothetical protein
MRHATQTTIGGVRFRLHSRVPLRSAASERPRTFLPRRPRRSFTLDARVRIGIEDVRAPVNATLLFEDGEARHILRRGSQRWIVHWPPAFDAPLWVACWRRHSAEIRVGAGRALLRAPRRGRPSLANPFSYPLDLLLVMYLLAWRRGAVLHAAGVRIGGGAVLFPGRSGTGKSTISRLLDGLPGTRVLSDDRIIVRGIGRGFRAFGTPWLGEGRFGRNASAPLKAFLFIRHGRRCTLRPLPPGETLERLLPVVSVPWFDRETADAILIFLGDLATDVPGFELTCPPQQATARYVAETMAGLKPAASRRQPPNRRRHHARARTGSRR